MKTAFLTAIALSINTMALTGEEVTAPAPAANSPLKAIATRASCILKPTKDNTAEGVVTFTKVEGGVKIVAIVNNLSPGPHGFHIHEFGDCSSPDGMSAGGHFNPKKTQHGAPDALERHAGDLGNIVADDNGIGHYERIDSIIQLNGPDTIIGRSIVIHANADDFKSQPAGNAGGRIACGVIEN